MLRAPRCRPEMPATAEAQGRRELTLWTEAVCPPSPRAEAPTPTVAVSAGWPLGSDCGWRRWGREGIRVLMRRRLCLCGW